MPGCSLEQRNTGIHWINSIYTRMASGGSARSGRVVSPAARRARVVSRVDGLWSWGHGLPGRAARGLCDIGAMPLECVRLIAYCCVSTHPQGASGLDLGAQIETMSAYQIVRIGVGISN